MVTLFPSVSFLTETSDSIGKLCFVGSEVGGGVGVGMGGWGWGMGKGVEVGGKEKKQRERRKRGYICFNLWKYVGERLIEIFE